MKRSNHLLHLALAAALVCVSTATALAAPEEYPVPMGRPVMIDGTIHETEWNDAAVIDMGDAGRLWMKHSENLLLLGVASTQVMVVNVLIQTESRIRILHSSAALGTAVYVAGEDDWQLESDFQWRCRDAGTSASAVEARERFMQDEGWVASIVRQGNGNHVEYQIAVTEEAMRFMLLLLPINHSVPFIAWPSDVQQDLLPGPIPLSGHANPTEWPILLLTDSSVHTGTEEGTN